MKNLISLDHRKKLLESWAPRQVAVGESCPNLGSPEEYVTDSPEQAVVQFFHFWIAGNYGNMARMLKNYDDLPIGKHAGQVRRQFEAIPLSSFSLLAVKHTAPAIADVDVLVAYKLEGVTKQSAIDLRLLYEADDGDTRIYPAESGNWYLMPGRITRLLPYE